MGFLAASTTYVAEVSASEPLSLARWLILLVFFIVSGLISWGVVAMFNRWINKLSWMVRALIAAPFPLIINVSILVFLVVAASGRTLTEAFSGFRMMNAAMVLTFLVILLGGSVSAFLSSWRLDRQERARESERSEAFK